MGVAPQSLPSLWHASVDIELGGMANEERLGSTSPFTFPVKEGVSVAWKLGGKGVLSVRVPGRERGNEVKLESLYRDAESGASPPKE
ncbi:hypothetical protein NMY22_g15057 [Coprinellus aureogranulatus]|nr:hypothetical protein NMY22_g15057 [Coprinellus aureogranulatus]